MRIMKRRSLFQFVCSVCVVYKYLCEGGGGLHKYFLYSRIPDLKICTSFFDVQVFYLCFVRGLCIFRFHPLSIQSYVSRLTAAIDKNCRPKTSEKSVKNLLEPGTFQEPLKGF